MAERTDKMTGTAFRGPLYVLDASDEVVVTIDNPIEFDEVVTETLTATDVEAETLTLVGAAAATPAAMGTAAGTADTSTFALPTVDDTGPDSALIDNNFATIAEVLNRILAVVQVEAEE